MSSNKVMLTHIANKLDAIDGHLTEHDKRLDAIDSHLTEHDKRLDAIDSHLTEHDKRLDAIDSHLTEHDKHLAAIDSRLDHLDHRVDRLETTVQENHVMLSALMKRTEGFDALRVNQEHLAAQIDNITMRMADATSVEKLRNDVGDGLEKLGKKLQVG